MASVRKMYIYIRVIILLLNEYAIAILPFFICNARNSLLFLMPRMNNLLNIMYKNA